MASGTQSSSASSELQAAKNGICQAEARVEAVEQAAQRPRAAFRKTRVAKAGTGALEEGLGPAAALRPLLVAEEQVSSSLAEIDELQNRCEKAQEVLSLRAAEVHALSEVKNASDKLLEYQESIQANVDRLQLRERALLAEEAAWQEAGGLEGLQTRLRQEAAAEHGAWEAKEEAKMLQQVQDSRREHEEALIVLDRRLELQAGSESRLEKMNEELQVLRVQLQQETSKQATLLQEVVAKSAASKQLEEDYSHEAREIERLLHERATRRAEMAPLEAELAAERKRSAEQNLVLEDLRLRKARASASARSEAAEFFALRRQIGSAMKVARDRSEEMFQLIGGRKSLLPEAHRKHKEASFAVHKAVEDLSAVLLELSGARHQFSSEKAAHDDLMQQLWVLQQRQQEASELAASNSAKVLADSLALCEEFRQRIAVAEPRNWGLRGDCDSLRLELKQLLARQGSLRTEDRDAHHVQITTSARELQMSEELHAVAATAARSREEFRKLEVELGDLQAELGQVSRLGYKYQELPVWSPRRSPQIPPQDLMASPSRRPDSACCLPTADP